MAGAMPPVPGEGGLFVDGEPAALPEAFAEHLASRA
ncbi:MAG: hypothetical protein K0S06_3968 [Microvirga sp.]|jgi:hypothetical protein|nr:hypothetical protein [Microvirga sp.]